MNEMSFYFQSRTEPFVTDWRRIDPEQKIEIPHDLGREPAFVRLEYSSDGINNDGSVSGSFADTGIDVFKKNHEVVVVQARKAAPGVVFEDGVETQKTDGWFRIIIW